MNQAVIFGRRRQGKSTLALAVGMAHTRAVVVFDPNSQYRAFRHVESGAEALRAFQSGERVVVVKPEVGDMLGSFEDLSAALWPTEDALPVFADWTLLVDEASCLQSPHSISPALERWLRMGPPDIRLIQTTHRVVDTHRLTRALATDVWFFSNASTKDLAMIESEFESPDLARAVAALGRYEVVHYWLAAGGERRWRIWSEPKLWYLPIAEETENDDRDREPEYAAAD